MMSVGSVCCECWGRCAASPEEVVCDTTVMGRSTMRAFVSSRAVLAAESVSKITTASCAPSLLASLQMPLIDATIVGCLSTYLRSVSLVILPQNEKKSDTVFSVALGDMFDTNTAFDSYYMCEHMQHSYITYSYLCHGCLLVRLKIEVQGCRVVLQFEGTLQKFRIRILLENFEFYSKI